MLDRIKNDIKRAKVQPSCVYLSNKLVERFLREGKGRMTVSIDGIPVRQSSVLKGQQYSFGFSDALQTGHVNPRAYKAHKQKERAAELIRSAKQAAEDGDLQTSKRLLKMAQRQT